MAFESEEIYKAIEDESRYYHSSFHEALIEYHDQILSTQWQSDALINPRYEYILSTIKVIPHRPKRDYCQYLDCELSLFSPAIKTDEFLTYLERRSTDTVNEIVRARCCHIIWLYNRRNDSYPTTAIASYRLFANKREVGDLNRITYLGNTFLIAVHTKDDIYPIKTKILEEIRSTDDIRTINVGLDLIVMFRKLFKSDLDERFFLHIHNTISQQTESGVNYFSMEIIEKVTKLVESLNLSQVEMWYELQAETNVKLASDQEPLFKLGYYAKAAFLYRKANNNEKANECNIEHRKIWETYGGDNFPKQVIGGHFSEFMKAAFQANDVRNEKILTSLKALPISATVIAFLSDAIIPNAVAIKESIKERGKPLYMHIVRMCVFDEAGNNPVNIDSEEQEQQHLFCQEYGLRMISVKRSLESLIPPLVAEGVLETFELMQLLVQSSILRELRKDSDVPWVEAVLPSLYYYFYNVHAKKANESIHVDFSLSIDSLILKLEGILRGVFELRGISAKKDGERKNVSAL